MSCTCGLSKRRGSGTEPGLGRGHCPAVPTGSPAVPRARSGGAALRPQPGEPRAAGEPAGGRRILLLHLLCNSSSGPPPRLLRGKSMCSDSVISQVASLQVHRARKGDISGHVWMGYTNTHTRVHIYTCMHPLSSLPSPAPAWHRIRWNFTTVACSCGGGSFVCVPGRQWRTPRSAALTSAPRSLWRGRCR